MKKALRILLALGFLLILAAAGISVNLAADRFAAQDRPSLTVAYTDAAGEKIDFRPECTASHWPAKGQDAGMHWLDTAPDGAQLLQLVSNRIAGSGIDLILQVGTGEAPDEILVQRFPDSRYFMEDGVLRTPPADELNVLWSREDRISTGRVTYQPGSRYVVTVYFGEAFAQYQFFTRRAFEDTPEANLVGFAFPMNESEPNQILFDPGEWIEASDLDRVQASGIGELSEYLSGLFFYNQDEQTVALELIPETKYTVTVVETWADAGDKQEAADAAAFFALAEETENTLGVPPLYHVEEAGGMVLSIDAAFLP